MAGLTMTATKESVAVPFITAFPILLFFCCWSIFETLLFILFFTFTVCSLRRDRGLEWVGLCCRKQWQFVTAVNWKKPEEQVTSV